ncbi:hypothetical protein GPECTOR_31g386 [Gonium pectorale]|uniref:SRCR domain-containing protein n=1 Tax=Gonium pectorale TaxID=33097 RepID=A0A150GDV5_GONPE|nr:hypothetical protein GPECTOR_31g386 [Gonium pectorale]|eukprot:KXZ48022.1 hypothetical protein GPECTOR_31g386 [Gonium pectorale]
MLATALAILVFLSPGGSSSTALRAPDAEPSPSPWRDGDLRLVDGTGSAFPLIGRLEVFFGGTFGAVCDDRFTDAAARVACRQLGLSGGQALCCGAFGPSAGPMLLDELTCAGNETRLATCAHNGWGQTDCKPSEAVAVRCSQGPADPGSGGAETPAAAAAGVLDQRQLQQAPPVRCLAAGTNATCGCTSQDDCFTLWTPSYYGPSLLTTRATYRLVYVYANGAHSCPAARDIWVDSDRGGPEIHVLLAAPLNSLRDVSVTLTAATGAAATAAGVGDGTAVRMRREVVLQRRGWVTSTRNVGPAWLESAWVDVIVVNDTLADFGLPEYAYVIDRLQYYNSYEGVLLRAGPEVAGWRWKYGSNGLTDGYVPSVSPELTATPNAGGINALYQLVFELAGGLFSFPHPTRFNVSHDTASVPLALYVQMYSTSYPADMEALLLQRVEGDAVWTVARLGKDSPEIGSGQRSFLFFDTTSRATFVTGVSVRDVAPSPPPPPGAAGAGDSGMNGSAGAASSGEHWGIAFSGVNLTLVDSVVEDLPLSPYGPLLWCRGCQVVRLVNTTLRGLGTPPASLLPAAATATGSGGAVAVHGPLAASGVRTAVLRDLTCRNVSGAHGWACVLLEMASEISVSASASAPSLSMERCTVVGNVLAQAPTAVTGAASTAAAAIAALPAAEQPLRRLLSRVGASGGAGAVALTPAPVDAVGGASAAADSSIAATSILMSDCRCTANSGFLGGVLYSALPTESLVIRRSVVTGNSAVGGGVAYLGANASLLVIREGSTVDNNTAGSLGGGAFHVFGSLGGFSVEGGSSVSGNQAAPANGGALYAELSVGSVSVTGGSSANGNRAVPTSFDVTGRLGFGGFVMSDGRGNRSVEGTRISVSDGSSVSDNFGAAGGVLFTYWLRSFSVSGRSRVERNRALFQGGVVSVMNLKNVGRDDEYILNRRIDAVLVTGSSSVSYNRAEWAGVLELPHWSTLAYLGVTNGSRFDGNRADRAPAGVSGKWALAVEVAGGSSVSDNVAGASEFGGGGVFYFSTSVDTLAVEGGSRVCGNVLADGDGAVLMTPKALGVRVAGRGTLVANNTARRGDGGFLAFTALDTVTVLDGAVVTGNSALGGGSGGVLSVVVRILSLDVRSATVSDNTAALDGGAFHIAQDVLEDVTIDGASTTERNRALSRNGGFLSIGNALGGKFALRNGSRLCSCAAGLSGGGVYIRETLFEGLYITGGSTACENTAEGGHGGAAFVGFGMDRVELKDGGRLTDNSAAGYGGAVYVGRPLANVAITAGSRVAGNHAGADGGAFYAETITGIVLSDGSVARGNVAGGNGGLASATRLTSLVIDTSTAANNAAGGSGGLVSVLTPPDAVTISGSNVTGNTAERGKGGALSIAVPEPGSALLSQVAPTTRRLSYRVEAGSLLRGNGAYLDGGAICIDAEVSSDPTGALSNTPAFLLEMTITDSELSGNYAGGAGGALALSSPATGALSSRVSIADSRLTANTAGSGRFRLGTSTSSGYGGAIYAASSPKFRADAVLAAVRSDAAAGVLLQTLPQLQLPPGSVAPDPSPPAGVAATATAGSVSLDSACALRLERVRFSANRCQGTGGAVAAVSCPTAVSSCTFAENFAYVSGGGLAALVESVGLDDIPQVAGSGNTGSSGDDYGAGTGSSSGGDGRGGTRRRLQLRRRRHLLQAGEGTGLSSSLTQPSPLSTTPSPPSSLSPSPLSSPWLDVEDSVFESNVARWECGGGLYAEVGPGAGSRIGSSVFAHNEAPDYTGGGLCINAWGADAVASIMNRTRFINNTALRFGGAVFATLGANAATSGGGGSGGSGSWLMVEDSELVANRATLGAGGALCLEAYTGSGAGLRNVVAEGNLALTAGGALFVRCGADGDGARTCGRQPLLTARGCTLRDNAATEGDGGALFLAYGAAAELSGTAVVGNRAGRCGGGVAASGCESLAVVGGEVANGSAGVQGGGVFAGSCSRVLLRGLAVTGNLATTGGGVFVAGPSPGDNATLPADLSLSGPPSSVGASVSASQSAPSDAAPAAAAIVLEVSISGNRAPDGEGYRRYESHGGGLFAFGDVALLVADSDLAGDNNATAGAVVASSQRCARPEAGAGALRAWRSAALSVSTATAEQETPSDAEAMPVWMLDASAGALQANCSQRASAPATAASGDCATERLLGPGPQRLCELEAALASCSVEDEAPGQVGGGSPAAAADGEGEGGALLDVSPTHIRLEAFSGKLRPGTPVSLAARLYNGLGLPIRTSTLDVLVTVSIEPADPMLSVAGSGGGPGNGSHLRPVPEHPWQDAGLAFLDPGSAAGGSLAVPFADGLASWPYLTVRGWPGRYVLVLTAEQPQDPGLYTIAPLRVEAELLHCQPGEVVDVTWSQQPGARPSWLSCEACSRGRFSLWRDERPSLWHVNATNYRQYMRDWSRQASEDTATCQPCPADASCFGGGVLVPNAGYWHSAPDSAQFHRCPYELACGGEADDGDAWGGLPPVSLAELEVRVEANGSVWLAQVASPPPGAATGSATSTSSSGGSGGSSPSSSSSWEDFGGLSTPVSIGARAGWLALCQTLGYSAMAAAASAGSGPGNTSGSGSGGGGYAAAVTAIPAAASGAAANSSALAELVAACARWGLVVGAGASRTAGGGYVEPYLQLECAEGYASRLCATCVAGYYLNAEFECRPCPTQQVNITLAILAFLGGVALVLYTSVTNFKENYAVTHEEGEPYSGERDDQQTSPSDFLKVAIVHVQYYIIITRLPVPYPDSVTKLQAAASAVTGAESTVAFSYSCFVPRQASDGQALAQLSGALLAPCIVVAASLVIWAVRFILFNRAKMRRGGNLRRPQSSRGSRRSVNLEQEALSATTSVAAATAEAAEVSVIATAGPLPPTPRAANGGGAADWHVNPMNGRDGGGLRGCAGSAITLSTVSDDDGGWPHTAAGAAAAAAAGAPGRESHHVLGISPFQLYGHTLAITHSGNTDVRRGSSTVTYLGVKKRLSATVSRAWKVVSRPIKNNSLLEILTRLDETIGLAQQMGIVFMLAVSILYPGWAQAALSVFACYLLDDGESGPFPERQQATWPYGYWIRDMAQECYSGTHLTRHVPIGIVAVFLVCLLPPTASFAVLWRNRDQLDTPTMQQRYGFLYTRYRRVTEGRWGGGQPFNPTARSGRRRAYVWGRPHYFWWESVLMLEELVLVAVEVFGRALQYVSHQILLMLAAFIVLSAVNMACSPVRSRLIVLLDFLSMAVLSLTITLSLYFVVNDSVLDSPAASNAVGIIILAINLGLLAAFVFLVVRHSWDRISTRSATIARGVQGHMSRLLSSSVLQKSVSKLTTLRSRRSKVGARSGSGSIKLSSGGGSATLLRPDAASLSPRAAASMVAVPEGDSIAGGDGGGSGSGSNNGGGSGAGSSRSVVPAKSPGSLPLPPSTAAGKTSLPGGKHGGGAAGNGGRRPAGAPLGNGGGSGGADGDGCWSPEGSAPPAGSWEGRHRGDVAGGQGVAAGEPPVLQPSESRNPETRIAIYID